MGGAQRETGLGTVQREINPLLARVYTFTVTAAQTLDVFLPYKEAAGLEPGIRILVVNRGIGGSGDIRLWTHDGDLGDKVYDFVAGTWEGSGSSADFLLTPGYLAKVRLGTYIGSPRMWLPKRQLASGRSIL